MVVSSSLSTVVRVPEVQVPIQSNTLNNMQLGAAENPHESRERDENEEPLKKKRRPRAKKTNKLSKEEVRQNHVSSEKKRRELVRTIYDDLVRMIPDLQPSENRSEMVIYMKTINHLNWLYRHNKRLRKQVEKKSKELGEDDYRIPESLVWELRPSSGNGLGNNNRNNDNDNGNDGSNTNRNNTYSNININTDTDSDNTNTGNNNCNESA